MPQNARFPNSLLPTSKPFSSIAFQYTGITMWQMAHKPFKFLYYNTVVHSINTGDTFKRCSGLIIG